MFRVDRRAGAGSECLCIPSPCPLMEPSSGYGRSAGARDTGAARVPLPARVSVRPPESERDIDETLPLALALHEESRHRSYPLDARRRRQTTKVFRQPAFGSGSAGLGEGKRDENQKPETAALLLKHSARIDAVNNEIQTPLHIASQINVLPYVVELLLDHGADMEVEDEMGRTPLDLALESKHTCFSAITLIERGAIQEH